MIQVLEGLEAGATVLPPEEAAAQPAADTQPAEAAAENPGTNGNGD